MSTIARARQNGKNTIVKSLLGWTGDTWIVDDTGQAVVFNGKLRPITLALYVAGFTAAVGRYQAPSQACEQTKRAVLAEQERRLHASASEA